LTQHHILEMTRPRRSTALETRTAFELEAMILAEMLMSEECPIGINLSVRPVGDGWIALVGLDDAACIARVALIAARLRKLYDLEE
jgi:hypothetical protein